MHPLLSAQYAWGQIHLHLEPDPRYPKYMRREMTESVDSSIHVFVCA